MTSVFPTPGKAGWFLTFNHSFISWPLQLLKCVGFLTRRQQFSFRQSKLCLLFCLLGADIEITSNSKDTPSSTQNPDETRKQVVFVSVNRDSCLDRKHLYNIYT